MAKEALLRFTVISFFQVKLIFNVSATSKVADFDAFVTVPEALKTPENKNTSNLKNASFVEGLTHILYIHKKSLGCILARVSL